MCAQIMTFTTHRCDITHKFIDRFSFKIVDILSFWRPVNDFLFFGGKEDQGYTGKKWKAIRRNEIWNLYKKCL